MSDFISNELHKKVDHIMDVFFGAGVASHPTIIEQINYLLFMRALSQSDDNLRHIGITDSEQLVFDDDLEKYRWDNLMILNAEQLFIALEECFQKIPESTTNKTVRLVFRNAHLKLFDKPTLRTVVHEIDAFAKLMDEGQHQGKRDIFGDTYEYLLSKLAQAGTSGQFRTPRHIIDFLVDVVAPQKGETIIDPAVGTAGFLVKAFEYLRNQNTSPEQLSSGGSFDLLNTREHAFLYEHTFSGFDSDEDMIKFGMMNLYLHGLQNARMVRQNTLTDTAGSRDKYDVILANPPFSGKIDRDSVAQELQMNTGATEVLFLRYIIRHLTENGRAGVIVPEGVLFNSSNAHKRIREQLLESGLWCVVSLPSGVFNPYAGVKTSILFFDKSHQRQEVLFAKVISDGYSLSSQRKAIPENDLPDLLRLIKLYKNNETIENPKVQIIGYKEIKETDSYSLSGDRYLYVDKKTNNKYEEVSFGDVSEIIMGQSPAGSSYNTTGEGIALINGPVEMGDKIPKSLKFTTAPTKLCMPGDTIMTIRATLGVINTADKEYCLGRGVAAFRPKDRAVITDEYLALILKENVQNLSLKMVGAIIKGISRTDLLQLKIILPPVDVQNKIVEEINKKELEIENLRLSLDTLEIEKNEILNSFILE